MTVGAMRHSPRHRPTDFQIICRYPSLALRGREIVMLRNGDKLYTAHVRHGQAPRRDCGTMVEVTRESTALGHWLEANANGVVYEARP